MSHGADRLESFKTGEISLISAIPISLSARPATISSVVSVSGACYIRYSSYALAAEAFNTALANGDVVTIP